MRIRPPPFRRPRDPRRVAWLCALRRCQNLGFLVFVWQLVAFVALPAAHIYRHAADHHHDDQGGVHRHTVPQRTLPAPERVGEPSDGLIRLVAAENPAHGDGGALHFRALLMSAGQQRIAPPPSIAARLTPPALVSLTTLRPPGASWQPRGPPLAA